MSGSFAILAGMLLAGGLAALVVAALPGTPRLTEALARLHPDGTAGIDHAVDLGSVRTRSERLGAFVHRRLRVPLSPRVQQSLRLQGRSVADFYGDKAALAITGAVLPSVVGFLLGYLLGIPAYVPVLAALLGAVLGFFVPDLTLLRATKSAKSAAVESLLVFIDLVTLERLANASAVQALHNAAQVSEAPLFVQMRTALERARLEQQSPYGELRRLAAEMDLPELDDVADVMQLDESGAALSGALRARVKELRDAHLSREQLAASAAAEGMTIYMTLPALVFGAIFMVAALLRILAN